MDGTWLPNPKIELDQEGKRSPFLLSLKGLEDPK
jgi:hypothetical protein